LGIWPLTLPSSVTPRREEGKYVEIKEEIPSPSTGEGQGFGRELSRTVGVIYEIISQLQGTQRGDEKNSFNFMKMDEFSGSSGIGF
jgi:hypothetical protein